MGRVRPDRDTGRGSQLGLTPRPLNVLSPRCTGAGGFFTRRCLVAGPTPGRIRSGVQLPDWASKPDQASRGWLLGLILVLAAVLRLWSLDFGLPHLLARPDETEIVGRAVRFFGWDLNPRFFHYPSFFFYLLGAVYAVWIGALALSGQPLDDTLAAAALDLSPYIVMAVSYTHLTLPTTIKPCRSRGSPYH